MDEGGGGGGEGGEGGEVAMLRQLIRQIQELCHVFGGESPPFQYSNTCYFLDTCSSFEDYNTDVVGEKSGALKIVEEKQPPPLKKSRTGRNTDCVIVAPLSSVALEPTIWKDLPPELLEAVFARLPIAAIFRFRSVCQKWNSLLTSNIFFQQYAEAATPCQWFYTLFFENIRMGAMYNTSSKKWLRPDMPPIHNQNAIFLPVASAGGLICFLDINNRDFYICNPLTSSVKKLPQKSVQPWLNVAVGMILNGQARIRGYKVVWIGGDGDYEVYDSLQNRWTSLGRIPATIKLPMLTKFRSPTVTIGSTLYFMRTLPDGIISYDVDAGVWKQYLIPLPENLSDRFLAVSGGKILLLGLVSKNSATCVYIWELQKMTLLWKEVDRMPNEWCLELWGRRVRMICLGNEGLLMLSLRPWRSCSLVVTYDNSVKDWKRVPDCVSPFRRKKQMMACGIAFYPCLGDLP